MATLEGLFCWEDDQGCICGNDCEPPQWLQRQWARERKESAQRQFDAQLDIMDE